MKRRSVLAGIGAAVTGLFGRRASAGAESLPSKITRYNWRTGNERGRVARLYDANGVRCRLKVFECEVETGKILFYAQDDNGRIMKNAAGNDVLTCSRHLPAPLKVVFL